MRREEGRLILRRAAKIKSKNGNRDREIRNKLTGRRRYRRINRGAETEQSGVSCDKVIREIEHVRVYGRSQLPLTTYDRWWWMRRTESGGRSMSCVCTIELSAMSSVSRRFAATDTQPPPTLATSSTAAVKAVARMVGKNGKVE